jgi:tetrapyrrole methylase family protein/MazG family protein
MMPAPPRASIEELLRLIATLRGEGGCPWDRKQTPASMTVYLVEEAHELLAAVAGQDPATIREELGDVLFQVLFVAMLYSDQGAFSLEDVCRGVLEKMIRRHPHVFEQARAESPEAVRQQWHRIKRGESDAAGESSVLESIPAGLPALLRAYRVSARAAATGFEWPSVAAVADHARREWAEFEAALGSAGPASAQAELELGDLLFTLINVARLAKIHPETALTSAIEKFLRRFQWMERQAKLRGQAIDGLSRAQFDTLWHDAKLAETRPT